MLNIRWVFMIGMGRSGTSVLSEAIASHSEFAWISNYHNKVPRFPWLAILNRFASCSFKGLSLRGSRKQNKGLEATVRKYLPHSIEAFPVWEYCCGRRFSYEYLINEKANSVVAEKSVRYMESLLKWHGKQRFFAKFTGPSRLEYLMSIFPNSAFICVIRDPRAVIASLLSTEFWKAGGGFERPWWNNGLTQADIEDWHKNGKSPEALAAVQWRRIIEVADFERSKMSPMYYTEVRYEDFVERPVEILARIFSSIGISMDCGAVTYEKDLTQLRNMNNRFRERLTPLQIERIEHLTAEVAAKKGYFFP